MLIVGLGNPGPRFEHTRHNIGAAAVAQLADLLKLKLKLSPPLTAWVARNEKVALARPNTLMNSAGPAVARLARALGISAPLIVSDDLDLPLGTMRFRTKGSAGGHRGLASIITALGTNKFPRLKLGIGRPVVKDEVIGYVLTGFSSEEKNVYERTLDRAAEALHVVVTQGLSKAMTTFSK